MQEILSCPLEISPKIKLVVNPWLMETEGRVIEKTRSIRVGFNHLGAVKMRIITYSVPVHLPELSLVISLDLTKARLRYELEEIMKKRSRNSIFMSHLYNFDEGSRRAVSWGNYCLKDVEEEFYDLYAAAVHNDLVFTPSTIKSGFVWSPNRYMLIQTGTGEPWVYCYNVFIAFFDPKEGRPMKSQSEFFDGSYPLINFPGKFIEFDERGYVIPHPINLSFTEEEAEDLKGCQPSYFMIFSEGFIQYGGNAGFLRGIRSINLVVSFMELVHTPYDIIPFLYPRFMNPEEDKELLVRFTVPKAIVERIIGRLEKFTKHQSRDLVSQIESVMQEVNPLFRIMELKDSFLVKLVNPALIPSLLGAYLTGKGPAARGAENLLKHKARKLMELLEGRNQNLEDKYALIRFNSIKNSRNKVIRCLKQFYFDQRESKAPTRI
jgi:hypothetical protein